MTEFDASAAALGFAHQLRWAMLELLRQGRKDPTLRVALETYDDVAVVRSDGSVAAATQLKHHASGGAVTNASADLWKTLRVWLSSPVLAEANGPRLLLITTGPIPAGSAASWLGTGDSRSPDQAVKALTLAANGTRSRATHSGRQLWLQASGDVRLALLRRVTVIGDAPNISEVDDLVREELATTVRAVHMDSFVEHLWGWWDSRCIAILRSQDEVQTIAAHQLFGKIHELRDGYTEGALIADPALAQIGDEELAAHESKPFVTQLGWIDVHGFNLRRAIINYHRAYTQTAKWVQNGDLVEDDISRFEQELVEEWQLQFESMCDQLRRRGETSEQAQLEAGRELFERLSNINDVRIHRSFVEPFLASGARHILADRGGLGWHPEFRERLAELVGIGAAAK